MSESWERPSEETRESSVSSRPTRIIVRRERARQRGGGGGWKMVVAIIFLVLALGLLALVWEGVQALQGMQASANAASNALVQQNARLSGIEGEISRLGLEIQLGFQQLSQAIGHLTRGT